MCGLWGEDGVWKKKEKNDLNLTDIKNFIDEVSRYKPMVLLTGGEPLLNQEWAKVAQYLREKKLRCSISTNGTLLKKYQLEILNFVDVLDVSLDGVGEIHNRVRGKNVFEDIIEGVQLIAERKKKKKKITPNLKISYTLNDLNADTITDTLEYLNNLNLPIENFQIRHLQSTSLDCLQKHKNVFREEFNIETHSLDGFLYSAEKINLKILKQELKNIKKKKYKNIARISFAPEINLEELEKFYTISGYVPQKFKRVCFAPHLGINIAPSGDIWMCPDYGIGNIKEDNFSKIWNDKKAKTLRGRIRTKGLFPACSICAGLYVY